MITHTAHLPGRKFRLGQMVATPGAIAALQHAGDDPAVFIQRHRSGDWGDVHVEDARRNDAAIAHESDPERRERVLSSYRTSANEKLWIITEADRSATTMLLPEEY
ncbi:MAG: hypothetical protein WCI73_17695 [Phycisphaerae bacterium]